MSRPSAATSEQLGLALLERLPGDVVLSPYGLARALNVVRNGASGATRAALDAMLGDPPPAVPGILSAQAVWVGREHAPGLALAGLECGPIDLERINAWSSEKTRGMIPRILEHANPDEVMVLTDAEYLKARWAERFDDARPAPFEGAGEVPMMSVSGDFEHGDDAVRLPYAQDDLRFVAMLGEWRDVRWRRGEGTVELPRFSTASSLELHDLLAGLGLRPAFDAGRELEALVAGPGDKALGRVIQRARVDVDEEGTEAAATTAVTIRAVSYTPPFHIVFDRPFTWAVEHAPTGTLLFVGRVLNPTERSA